MELNGRLNKCGVISPRYNVGVGELEAWTARLLPSRQVSDALIPPVKSFQCKSSLLPHDHCPLCDCSSSETLLVELVPSAGS